jgi:MFS transporter, DHA3 family, tetracycline resistance protein
VLLIFRQGLALAHRDHQILLMFAATTLVNGAAITTWLFPRQLVDLGFPHDLALWYTALGILSAAAGVVALRIVEAHIDGARAARASYAVACLLGTLGLVLLATAPNALIGSLGVLLASGIGGNVARAVSVIWVNRRTPGPVRATVHSFLSQAETVGEVVGGSTLTALAQAAGIAATLLTSAALLAGASALVARSRAS